MIPDPTDEIRAIRRKLAAQCNNDLHRIAEETRRHQHESGREFVTLPKRCPATQTPTNQALNASGRSQGS